MISGFLEVLFLGAKEVFSVSSANTCENTIKTDRIKSFFIKDKITSYLLALPVL